MEQFIWEEYNVKKIQTSISLPENDSQIKYKIQVTNFGNVEMGIFDITGLPDNLEYVIEDYKLGEKICVDNECKLGIQKDFYIIIKYKDGFKSDNIDYIIDLNFDFRAFYKIQYTGFPAEANTLPNEIIANEKLRLDLSKYEYGRIRIKEDGVLLS